MQDGDPRQAVRSVQRQRIRDPSDVDAAVARRLATVEQASPVLDGELVPSGVRSLMPITAPLLARIGNVYADFLADHPTCISTSPCLLRPVVWTRWSYM